MKYFYIFSFFLGFFFLNFSQAQVYPSKPIKIIVPTGPGGGADTSARFLAAKLSNSLNQSVFIENVGGAGGIIGADRVAKSNPDGHTLLFGFNALVTMVPYLTAKMPYLTKDLEPIGITYRGGYILLASNNFPANNLNELFVLAKSKPDEIAFASTGNGSAAHLGAELLQQMAKIKLLHVPFKSTGLIELMANQVQIKFEPMASGVPLASSGKLKALAVTGPQRAKILPSVISINEVLPEFKLIGWQGLWAPKGTSKEIVLKLNNELVKFLKDPEVQQKMIDSAALPNDPSPESMTFAIETESAIWEKIIRERQIKTE
jgi:tripartite-type tricarboxylate transporter receptor subunit TctC